MNVKRSGSNWLINGEPVDADQLLDYVRGLERSRKGWHWPSVLLVGVIVLAEVLLVVLAEVLLGRAILNGSLDWVGDVLGSIAAFGNRVLSFIAGLLVIAVGVWLVGRHIRWLTIRIRAQATGKDEADASPQPSWSQRVLRGLEGNPIHSQGGEKNDSR